MPTSQEVTVLPRMSPVSHEIYESLTDSSEDEEWGGISDYEAAALKKKAENIHFLKSLGVLKV